MVIDSGREWLDIQWVKGTLYFHLMEKIAKSLHHGLSDISYMILVNTLTSENSKSIENRNDMIVFYVV